MSYPTPLNDAQRLAVLQRYHILDSLPEEEFDRITRLTQRLLNTPVVTINLIDVDRGWFKSRQGLTLTQIPRAHSICAYTILTHGVLSVPDLRADPRFRQYPLIRESGVRAYIGAPLITPDGYAIGTLCAHDVKPRTFTPEEQTLLADLAAIVMDELELRRNVLTWQRAEARTAHQAHHDALTGLPNRLLLKDRADLAFRHAHRRGTIAAMLVVDLDGFKTINDTYGHLVGDEVLRLTAERLRDALRAEDTVARFGGDEFVVLLSELRDPLNAARVAQQLLDAIEPPMHFEDHEVQLHASVGIALYPTDARSFEELLRAADTAMYGAKRKGRAQVCFHTEAMSSAATDKLRFRQRFTAAIASGELRLHYQPQVDLRSGRVIGMEALLRWPQPDGSWVPPQQFIPLAEETGLIVPLGAWALREACAQLALWHAQGHHDWHVSVNVSVKQWSAPGFMSIVRDALTTSGVSPGHLILEVTESVLIWDVPGVRSVLNAIEALGVRVALDDFGTGYSNLSRLMHVHLSQLKVTPTLMAPVPEADRAARMMSSVISLGRQLSAAVVGEGVETELQRHTLLELGCEIGQGYLFGPPAPPEALRL
ncbi:putative bifunctional diguanylate cyclase/phosphodiesterase [Deinococcus maricopensis]|uniref:Diguanylate cyclase/phosphodiesterase with GAF sensor n=1 Tax=Deinococcus maricopensis (strain DSM 21211 / LMG 22137 / NRRL B-23946 / LB-34) TaxID=709986 RepID=E8U3D7_DEIML|nr:EAL domain-containing protein [Deinococcus maricopensis]ADV65808.1 diguanylate cyclase/phosphodiesterase with GAF sensor [Deinococcus maricopensis DSM 21211]